MDNVEAEFVLFTLPARKWKMRMQLSAVWFHQKLLELHRDHRCFDSVLCSSFVDVSVLRALNSNLEGWDRATRFCTYFHENQFAYPNQCRDSSYFQFTAINFNTALSSDKIAFNSRFNRMSFLDGCQKYLKKAGDMKMTSLISELEEKSEIIYPGIELERIASTAQLERISQQESPVIIWNHRWEHDKNPEEFFEVLQQLKKLGYDFGIIVLGQSFKNRPACFSHAERELQERIVHFGYAESRDHYLSLLHQGTIVVSTAIHEFYGMAVIEAVRAGCYPVLPDRLSYPELFEKKYLYRNGQLLAALIQHLEQKTFLAPEKAVSMTEEFGWPRQKAKISSWLLD